MLVIEKTIDRLAKENGLRWYGHALRREEGNALKMHCILKSMGQEK